MQNTKRILIGFVVLASTFFGLYAPSAQAAVTPISFGILPPVQFPSDEYTITGFRLSLLWGHHRDLYGLDIGGLGNVTDQAFVGTALSGVFNLTQGNTTIIGLQLAGITNCNLQKTEAYGVQAALGLNYNKAESKIVGVQIAALGNVAAFTNVYGAQIGIYNSAQDVYGLQIGLVNVAQNLHGIQIGLANFHLKGLFYVAPILNVGF